MIHRRKNKDLHRGLLIALLSMVITLAFGAAAYADSATVYPTNVQTAGDGNILIGVPGTFYNSNSSAVLKKINKARYLACRDQKPKPDADGYPGTTKLHLDTDYGENPTDEQLSRQNGDYIPMVWSAEIERNAEIRSAEASIKWSHIRPGCGSSHAYNMEVISGSTYHTYGECLSGVSTASGDDAVMRGIDLWIDEQDNYSSSNGYSDYGHYSLLITPKYYYIGLSAFKTDDNKYMTIALETGKTPSGFTFTETPRSLTGKAVQTVEADAAQCSLSIVPSVSEKTSDGNYTLDLANSDKLTFNALYTSPDDENDKYNCTVESTVTWTSSDNSVAAVSGDGTVTPKSGGETTITASTQDDGGNTYSASIHLTVKASDHEHEWDEGTITKEATCSEEGEKTYTCSTCRKTKTEVIPKNRDNHIHTEVRSEKAATCTEMGYTGDTYCTDCGNKLKDGDSIPALGHVWDEGKVTKAATTTEAGTKVYTCKRCGETRTETIPATASSKGSKGSAEESEQKILQVKSDKDLSGSSFAKIHAKALKASNSGITVQWNHVSGAKSYAVYGAKCGSGSHFKKLKTTSGFSYKQTKLKKGTYYKYIIVAIDSNGSTKATSKAVYVATTGGKYGNYKAVKVSKPSVTLKKGNSFNPKAAAVKANKKLKVKSYRKIAFETGNSKIATVSSKGTIKAKAKGSTTIYCYAQNGAYKAVTVKVK